MTRRRPAKNDARGHIWCMGCQAYLSPFKFGKYATERPPARCRKCRSTAAHNERVKAKYGITAEAYQQLLDYQGGACAICLRPSRVRRLAVDHDHATGRVRGLLCRHCNYELLGWYKDDPAAFSRAINYLNCPPTAHLNLDTRSTS